MMKLRLIYLLLLVSFTAMAVENVEAEDKRSAKKQERLEKKQARKEKREERKEEKAAQKEENTQASQTVHQEAEVPVRNVAQEDLAASDVEEPIYDYEEVEEEYDNTISEGYKKKVKAATLKGVPSEFNDVSDEAKEEKSEDDTSPIILIIIFVVMCVVGFFSWLFSRRCPKCKKLFGMRVVDETFMGHSKLKREKDSHGEYRDVFYSNIKVTRKCCNCGYVDYRIVERKGTKE